MTATVSGKTPVIIGVGQYVQHPKELDEAKTPFEMIREAVGRAVDDTGVSGILSKTDTLSLVNIISLSSKHTDPPTELAAFIGANPKNKFYTWIGASAPQWFVNRTTERIFSGESEITLICGGEAFYSRRVKSKARAMAGNSNPKAGSQPSTEGRQPKKAGMVGDLRDPVTAQELKYGLVQPIHVYPLFENALRFHQGLSLDDQRKELGAFLAGFSAIAAENPNAWFRDSKTSDEISIETPDNRMISHPYTKNMCSIMGVDQSAALFMTNEQTAESLGVPEDQWIYPLGSGDASDVWHVTERDNFHTSPSAKLAADKALQHSGVTLDEVDYLDLYSCFPIAPRITRNMLGMAKDDPRPLTITGGMQYFGGPGNNYALNAICNMVERLRKDPAKIGLVDALSWFISKHSVGVYSGSKRNETWAPLPPESYKSEIEKLEQKAVSVLEEASGTAVVETYTLFHDRTGAPVKGVIVGRLDDGSRFLANTEEKEEVFKSITENEFIGSQGRVEVKDGFNVFYF